MKEKSLIGLKKEESHKIAVFSKMKLFSLLKI